MDTRNPETRSISQPRQLTKIRPGTKCRLVEILGVGGSRHRGRMGRGKKHGGGRKRGDPDCPFRRQRGEGARGIMKRLMDLGITRGCTIIVVQTGGHVQHHTAWPGYPRDFLFNIYQCHFKIVFRSGFCGHEPCRTAPHNNQIILQTEAS